MCLLLTVVSRTVTQLYTYDDLYVFCCCWFFIYFLFFIFLCPEVSIQIQGVHSNPSTNQLTEQKHSKRKALYRPLERKEPLRRKAGWETKAQSVKRIIQKKKKKKRAQPSIDQNKTTTITNKKLGRRRPKRMSYEEPILRMALCHTKNQFFVWHSLGPSSTCFSYGELPWTPPLEGTSPVKQ